MMRGLLYSSLRKAMPVVTAGVVTSALFAIAHLPEGGSGGPLYIAALDTFVLGLVLVYLRQKTDGLWASMSLHALKNGIAFIALFLVHVR
jgi:membrane protease YdiL (CAAX protease family)